MTKMSRRSFLAATAAFSVAPAFGVAGAAQAGEKSVTVLHIADIHAQLETHLEFMPEATPEIRMMGGLARLRTAIDRERAKAGEATFLIDSGDAVQGSGPAAWSEGDVVVEPLNSLGLDVFLPGNWEPVYGPKRFKELMGRVKAEVIAYNFHETDSGRRLFKPAVTISKGGVRVAFVGLADPTTTVRQPPDQVRGLDSTRLDGLRDYVKTLRASADLVIAVSHTGLTVSRQIARENPELDVILSGHTHERTERVVREGRTLIIEPGSLGSFLGRLDLTLDAENQITSHRFKLIEVNADDYAEHPATAALVTAALAPHRQRMNKVVGKVTAPLLRYDVLETTTDDFISDAVKEITGAQIGLTNGFRFGPPVLPGPLTVADLWNMLPLDARMKSGTVTGRQLREYLENELELVFSRDAWKLSGGWGPRASGMTIKFTAGNPAGKRLVSLKVNGREVGDDESYTIGGCERAGEPLDMICRLKGARAAKIAPLTIHEGLLEYLKKNPTITVRRENRSVATDLPSAVFSQDKILMAMK
jgi:2',3'-cyclic-nucleotide 2'-phosphodiesterase (5'-nucleotidase family)